MIFKNLTNLDNLSKTTLQISKMAQEIYCFHTDIIILLPSLRVKNIKIMIVLDDVDDEDGLDELLDKYVLKSSDINSCIHKYFVLLKNK